MADTAMDILIVDDDPDIRRVHARLLERAGFMVLAVEDGLAALAELKERSFRAIVCDIRMPFLAGKSFYEELLESYPDAAERVIFVSAFADDEPTHRFLEESGRPYLRKPVDLSELVNVVRWVAERGS